MKNSFEVVLLIYLEVTVAYDFTCPQPSQWRQRALQKCKTEKYHCLFDVNSEIFKELCKKSSFPLVEGVRAVLSEQISTDPCPKELYMPYIIATNESPDCIFYKSTCKEEGQIQCQIRSAAEDAACTCDYLDGYAFIHAPKHTKFCIPSEEDCSCYKKQCSETETLSQDYICIPKPETCSGQYFHKMINNLVKEECKNVWATKITRLQTCQKQVNLASPKGDIIEVVIPTLTVAMIICFLTSFCLILKMENTFHGDKMFYNANKDTKSENISVQKNEKPSQNREQNQTDEDKNDTSSKNVSVHNQKNEQSSQNRETNKTDEVGDIFLFHCKNRRHHVYLEGDMLKENDLRDSDEPRILDMCFMIQKNTLFLVWIDADNNMIVKYDVHQENTKLLKSHRFQHQPNRLTKVDKETVAIIYKKKFDIMIFNVNEMKEVTTYTLGKDFPTCGIQGVVAASKTMLILSDKTTLYRTELEKAILTPEKFGHTAFDTARRLTHVTIYKDKVWKGKGINSNKEIIFIADENDKLIISEGMNGSEIDKQESHNRGLQNVRAIVATENRLYAATSAGVSVYCHSEGKFKLFDEVNSSNKNYRMLLEYQRHVEHTRSLCLEKFNDRFYLGLSGVIKQRDFILLFSFEKNEDFC